MKATVVTTSFIVLSVLFFTPTVSGQAAQYDSSFYQQTVGGMLTIYHQSLGDQSALKNGRMYKQYPFRFVKGHAWFLTDKFSVGSVVYDGVLYENISLLYDEVQEIVVMLLAEGGHVQLTNEKIASFTIDGHAFVRIEKDSVNKIATGFYEELYSGNTQVLKKEKKTIKEELSSSEGVLRSIEQKNDYYVRKDGVYHSVHKKGSLLSLLKDRKKELQQFIKANGLNFKRDTDRTLQQAAAYYDQLNR